MASLGTLDLGTYNAGLSSNTALQGSNPVLEVIASTDDADYVYDATNSTHTGVGVFELANMPSDFGTMSTVSINLRYAWAAGTQVNDWLTLTAQIYKSDGTTALTNAVTIASSITTTTLTNSGAVALTGVDTAATKADWDGAYVFLRWSINKNKSGDTLRKNVYAAEVTGTYSQSTQVSVGKGTVATTGFAPTTVTTQSFNISPNAGNILESGLSPSVKEDILTSPSAGSATYTGYTPDYLARLRPSADVSVGSWTNEVGSSTNLYQSIDEFSGDDGDYIISDPAPVNSAVTFALPAVTDPGNDTNHTVYYRYSKTGDQSVSIIVRLKQDSTVIKSATHNNVSASFTDGSMSLSEAEAANITNYALLRVEFEATAS